MYNKVVVPLDGSKLAETALPHLEEIAKGCNIPEILLVSVTESIRGRVIQTDEVKQSWGKEDRLQIFETSNVQSGYVSPPDPDKMSSIPVTLGRMSRTAYNYLARISKQLEKKGLNSQIHVLTGNPADEIIRFAEEQNADLIVIASRGKSGFNRWDMGNIAEKVIRASRVPVMMVKPEPGFKETRPRRKGSAT